MRRIHLPVASAVAISACRVLLLLCFALCVAGLGAGAAASPATAATTAPPRVVVEYSNPNYAVYGVDSRGVSYGVSGNNADQNALYVSSDRARTWSPLYYFPHGWRIVLVRPLGGSTLLAGVLFGTYQLWRSGDYGRTWTKVFDFPKQLGLLTSHSVATDGHGRVYMAAYNFFKNPGNHRVPILRSTDDGRTWKVVDVVTTSRHAHGTSYDPYTGDVYVCFGDWGPQSQILRSTDQGKTWSVFIRGYNDRAVDLAFDRKYVYFGQDNQDRDAIIRADKKTGATSVVLANSLGASYSALRLADGTFLVGEAREPEASIAVGHQHTVHLFASRDGSSWVDVLQRRIPGGGGTGVARMDAYYQYPDGSVPLLISGYGTVVVRVGPPFPIKVSLKSVPGSGAKSLPAGVAPAEVASGSALGGLKLALTILLYAAAFLMILLAVGVRRLNFERGPVAVRALIIQPVQLVAGAASLIASAVVVSFLT